VDICYEPATAADASAIAMLHADSWRDAYRGTLPDDFLAGPVLQNRQELWQRRFAVADGCHTIKAIQADTLIGFGCVIFDGDSEWGADLDNLHVRAPFKGLGVGARLLHECRSWIRSKDPVRPMYLWVLENNLAAKRFYDRQGGVAAERRTVEVTAGIRRAAVRYVWPPLESRV
jgi:ribosomal protein S18 acetylase RimI-like enzyme